MNTITRAEAVERFGNFVCKRHFNKNNTIISSDIECDLIRTMLQHYETVERRGRGSKAHYILDNKRIEPISWYKVKMSDVQRIRRTKSRNYTEDFYREDTCTIYLATNIITNEKYVGSTRRPLVKRINEHKCNAFNENSSNYNTLISQAIRKYGFDSFTWQVIQHWEDEKTLKNVEDLWIINCKAIQKGYNSKFNHIKMDVKKLKEQKIPS